MVVSYQATVTVELPEVVLCRHCRREFLYRLRKTGTGADSPLLFVTTPGEAQQKAAAIAQRKLAAQLTPDSFNVVPCRHCFFFQPFMRAQAAKEKYGPDRNVGLVLAGLAFGALVIGLGLQLLEVRDVARWVMIAGACGVVLGGIVHWFMRRMLAGYDPNRQPEVKRRLLAEERCFTWDEFNRDQELRLAQAYQEHVGRRRGRVPAKNENHPPAPLWLPARAFINGLTLPVQLAPGKDVTVEVVPDTEPGAITDLVPGDGSEPPFRASLLAIRDYYGDSLEDEDGPAAP